MFNYYNPQYNQQGNNNSLSTLQRVINLIKIVGLLNNNYNL